MLHWLRYQFYRRVRASPIQEPIFIIGCGRSGTTILGQSFAQHPMVTYLNEPRNIWTAAYPETDVWSARAEDNGGRLRLTHAEWDASASRRLRSTFNAMAKRSGKRQLVEKLPANAFRISFVLANFPDARFINIVRNGIDVARSIARQAEGGGWYGADDYKWLQLRGLALSEPDYRALPDVCETWFHKGLLEWRMSVEITRRDLAGIPEDRRIEVRYEDLTGNPVLTMRKLMGFARLERSAEVDAYVAAHIHQGPRESTPLSDTDTFIGGKLLAQMVEQVG